MKRSNGSGASGKIKDMQMGAEQAVLSCIAGQVVSKLATELWKAAAEAYMLGRSLVLLAEGRALLGLLDDLEELLATNRCSAAPTARLPLSPGSFNSWVSSFWVRLFGVFSFWVLGHWVIFFWVFWKPAMEVLCSGRQAGTCCLLPRACCMPACLAC